MTLQDVKNLNLIKQRTVEQKGINVAMLNGFSTLFFICKLTTNPNKQNIFQH